MGIFGLYVLCGINRGAFLCVPTGIKGAMSYL